MSDSDELTTMTRDVTAVSHEVRATVSSIRGSVAALLDSSSEFRESQLSMLRTIERNAEALERTAGHLVTDPAAGRGLRANFCELDLTRLAHEAVEAIETSATLAGVGSPLRFCNEPVPVMGDRTRLDQCWEPAFKCGQVRPTPWPGARRGRHRGRLRPGQADG
jgi:hypothetical protein